MACYRNSSGDRKASPNKHRQLSPITTKKKVEYSGETGEKTLTYRDILKAAKVGKTEGAAAKA